MQERARQLLEASAAAALASVAETLPDVPGVDLDERINDMLNRLVNREDAFDVLLAIHQCRGELRLEPGLEAEGETRPRDKARKKKT